MDTGFVGIMEESVSDFVGGLLLQQFGGAGRSYRMGHRKACSRSVSEMYSPPRVTADNIRSKHKFFVPGFALDFTVLCPDDGMPWNFSIVSKRDKA